MRQADAKTAIQFEWRDWPEKSPVPTDGDMREFVAWLERERPHLLSFRTRGSRTECIKAWLAETRAVGAGV